jgi:hypothetical protein
VFSPTGDCCAMNGVAGEGVATVEWWLSCRPTGDNVPTVVELPANNIDN